MWVSFTSAAVLAVAAGSINALMRHSRLPTQSSPSETCFQPAQSALDSHFEIMELDGVALVVGAGKILGLTDVKLLT